MTKRLTRAFFAAFLAPLLIGVASATDYFVDSQNGDDLAAGTSPETAWRTLGRVSDAKELQGGDVVKFKKGCVWRDGLQPRSGEVGKPILYTSYGEGEKPSFWRSTSLADPSCWLKEGENLWATRPRETRVLGPATLAIDIEKWGMHNEGNAKTKTSINDGTYRIEVLSAGTAPNHIQWTYAPFAVENGKQWRLSFEARANKPANYSVSFMKSGAPWSSYGATNGKTEIGEEFARYELDTTFIKTAEDGRVTFYFGKLEEGTVLEFRNFNVEEIEVDELQLTPDVGNIILDGNKAAFKKWTRDELTTQDDFMYDREDGRVWYYSEKNPADAHETLEAARMIHVINLSGVTDAVFDGLDLRYGAAHGFGGSGNQRCVIQNCDISWIGGGDQYLEGGKGRRTRFGNGIEFWSDAQDHKVLNNRIWEVYDAALTNQGSGVNVERNIVYVGNLIWNCEYSFEYWNRGPESKTQDIVFAGNACLDAGYGWGHVQRRDPNGRCLMIYSNEAQTTNFQIVGNYFVNATDSLVRNDKEWTPEEPKMENNIYWQDDESKPYALWHGKTYSGDEFEAYRQTIDGEKRGEKRKITREFIRERFPLPE